jgi:hypothetical protein
MYATEDEEYAVCAACDGEVIIADRVYVFGCAALCFDCAKERHGIYHEILERWTIASAVDDLLADVRDASSSAAYSR